MALHPQILTMMNRNQNNENPINEQIIKKIGDILCSPTSIIGSEQVTNLQIVIHLDANVGPPMGERQTENSGIVAHIN